MYNIVLADPPWRFKVRARQGLSRSAENHYPTMTLAEIMALRVHDLAAKDCALFLWVPMPQLVEGLATMACWGFDYKTVAFTWVKQTKRARAWHMGLGYWTRANAELCLLGTRGAPKRQAKDVRQLVVAPLGAHSAKPPEIRERIVRLMGDLPRVELFARQAAYGWDSWGNEVPSDISAVNILGQPAFYDYRSITKEE